MAPDVTSWLLQMYWAEAEAWFEAVYGCTSMSRLKGWPGVVMVLGLALSLAMLVALRLRRLAPLGAAEK